VVGSIRPHAQALPPRGPSRAPDPAATRLLHPAALTVVHLTERLPAEHAALADGDEIRIGPAVLVFRTSAGNRTTETWDGSMTSRPR